jgi:hypothetical protein
MAAGTVKTHVGHINTIVKNCQEINLTPHLPPRGPMLHGDPVGMGSAVDLLMKSLTAKGKIKTHIQFGAMRTMRGTYTKMWISSVEGSQEGFTFTGGLARVRMTTCPAQSDWFKAFLDGAEDRMGFDTKNQKPVSILCLIKQLEMIKSDMEQANGADCHFLVKLGAMITLLTAGTFRDHEGFYLDIAST